MERELTTDYFIAGTGIAGTLVASQLAAAGKRIVLIDQGPRFTEEERERMLEASRESLNDYADYNDDIDPAMITPHTSAASGKNVVEWTALRLFGVGGTALHFEGLMLRPREEDLQVRSRYGYGRDWPISYADLEPWLLRAEQETGVAGGDDNPYASFRSGPFPTPAHPPSYFDREIFGPALQRLGIRGHSCPRAVPSRPYRGRSQCLACRLCKFCPSGARYSPDRVHILSLDANPNVTILPGTSLRRLETDRRGTRIVAAHAIRIADKQSLTVKAGHYILALGGVETPRMLLLSAAEGDHRDGLGNMGGRLGRGFSDHLNPYVTFELGRPAGSRLGFETMITDHFRARDDRGDQPGFVIFASPAMDWFPIGTEATTWATNNGRLSLERLRESIPRIATLATMTELEGVGMLELDETTKDELGLPVAKVTLPLTERDRWGPGKLVELAPRIGEVMGAVSVSEVTPPEFGLGYHPSGTTAMALSPDTGVCDPNLRVFGIDNLFLASNSVFPQMGANPPTLTIAALALRLADHLKGGNR